MQEDILPPDYVCLKQCDHACRTPMQQPLGAGMIPTRPRQHRRQRIQASSMVAPRTMARALLPLPPPPRLRLPMAVRAHLLQPRGAGLLRPRSRGRVTGPAPVATPTSPGGVVSYRPLHVPCLRQDIVTAPPL